MHINSIEVNDDSFIHRKHNLDFPSLRIGLINLQKCHIRLGLKHDNPICILLMMLLINSIYPKRPPVRIIPQRAKTFDPPLPATRLAQPCSPPSPGIQYAFPKH